MIKKILTYLLQKILLPLLERIIEQVVKELAHWIIERLRAFFREWQKRDEDSASSDSEREEIQKRHERIDAELSKLEADIPAKVHEIISTTFEQADEQANLLLRNASKTPELKNIEKQLQKEELPS
jgi:hypothetical protein